MISKKRFFVFAMVSLCMAVFLLGIPSSLLAQKLAEKQELSISLLAADMKTADPHFAATTSDRIIVDMIFNGLIRYKPGNYPESEPDLSVNVPEPKMADGKQVWLFKLRKGVVTHPFPGYPKGYELTAEDVVFSFQRAADPDRSAWAGEYPNWMHVEAMDNYTIKITLDKPLSKTLFFPKVADYAGGFIVPKKAVETLGEKEFKTHPVGTGPFMFENYLPAERIILRRNDNYFRGKPILTKINGVFMGDVTSAELALRKGELQAMIGPTEQAWVDKISQVKGIVVDIFGPGEVATLSYNMKKPPLDNIKVRKAMAYAYSRKELMALFGNTIAAPMYSPVPVGFLAGGLSDADLKEAGIDWEMGKDDIDIEKAKQLLSEAGYPKGVELNVYSSERGYYLQPYQIFQAQLRKIGINLKINKVDHATYHSMIRKDANHIVLYNSWRPNADVYLTRFYHSASAVVTGEKPDTNFSHKEDIDHLIEQARFETDSKKQEALWKQAQLSLLKDVACSTFCINRLTCARTDTFDWGHSVKASVALYPQITETSRLLAK